MWGKNLQLDGYEGLVEFFCHKEGLSDMFAEIFLYVQRDRFKDQTIEVRTDLIQFEGQCSKEYFLPL